MGNFGYCVGGSWKESCRIVDEILSKSLYNWEFIVRPGFGKNAITSLVKEGWHLVFEPKEYGRDGWIDGERKKVVIALEHEFYAPKRDVILLHELVHAYSGHFGENLQWRCITIDHYGKLRKKLEILVDHLARKARMDPFLLDCALKSFDLPLVVYDKVTYDIYSKIRHKNQFSFDFLKDYTKNLKVMKN